MSPWNEIQDELIQTLDELTEAGCTDPYFRGHSDSRWKLMPSLARAAINTNTEARFYSLFTSLGSPFIDHSLGPWEKLYLMQHHGLMTRLLDWTENFATALFFALMDASSEATVWILDPFALNHHSCDRDIILDPVNDYPHGYDEYFIDDASGVHGEFPDAIVAITPNRFSGRLLAQRGGFTFHRDLSTPLEELYREDVHRITIPAEAFPEARRFVSLAGINHYSLFPDLDGLARYLMKDFEAWRGRPPSRGNEPGP